MINDKYVVPLMTDLAIINIQEFSDATVATDKITNLFLNSFTSPVSTNSGRINKHKHARLPRDVKVARNQCKNALESWKQVDFL